ncbi:protein odr-4 homolog [Ananas comosus]|uniref:Protein odr-4 homolog n=1 Tax=Ananas comosus TaxID=4615 RepID=A0A6P5GY90_ANACO|nr:protein odr-4 homolog [Ananas comosus]
MVKTVVGEETLLKPFEDRLFESGSQSQVGLVIGKLSPNSERGFVYALIPTPPTDGGGPACSLRSEGGGGREEKKKGSKGGKSSNESPPSIVIDGDWVSEHARQVSRMMIGGMEVIGIYMWASEASFKATSPATLVQVIRGVAEATPRYESGFDERLLIHISYSPRRWASRICTLASANLQPCDFKMGKLLASLQAFSCAYNFEIRLPIDQAFDSTTFKNVTLKGINHLAKEVQFAKVLIDGNLVTEDLPAMTGGLHKVEFLLPFKGDALAEARSIEEVAGLVVYHGTVFGTAYLGPREPVSQAISDLKGDIITSLRCRLDIIADEAEVASSASDAVADQEGAPAEKPVQEIVLHELRKHFCLSFPRRVLVPWFDDVFICDYLQPSETFEDTKDRCKEMLSMETPPEISAMLEPESETAFLNGKSFWDVVKNGDVSESLNNLTNETSSSRETDTRKSKNSNSSYLVALLVLLAALFIGFAVAYFGSSKAAP